MRTFYRFIKWAAGQVGQVLSLVFILPAAAFLLLMATPVPALVLLIDFNSPWWAALAAAIFVAMWFAVFAVYVDKD